MHRSLRRLGLAGTLAVIAGFSRGPDGAVVVALSLVVMELDANLTGEEPPMLVPIARPDPRVPTGARNGPGQEAELAGAALRRNYRDAVRLATQEEILAELAEEVVTARLHSDTARFHHGSAHAYAKALYLLIEEALNVFEDKQAMRAATRETDLAPMRCLGRRYRPYEADRT
jgi:hypothetical protein